MRQKRHWGNVLGVIALLISLSTLVVLVFILCNIEEIDQKMDYLSFVIGSFALIVSVLIGYQITNIVQIDRKFEDIVNETTHKIETSLQHQTAISIEMSKKAENDAIGTALMMVAWSFLEKNEIDDAMRALINSLRAFQQGNLNDSTIIGKMHDVEDSLIEIAKTEKGPWAFHDIDEKNVYIDTVMKIQDKNKMNILLNFFYSFSIRV